MTTAKIPNPRSSRREEAQKFIGWRTVKLGEVCELNPRRPKLDRPLNTPTTFVQMSAVDENGGGIARPELRPYGEVVKGYTYFGEGDVIFAKITPCMQNGKHAIARNLQDGIGFGSTEFHVLRPTKEVLPEWIYSFLMQPSVMADAEADFTGSGGQLRVPEKFLAEVEIPLPPLAEQRRLAARLREQMSEVERARAAVQAQLDAAQTLPAALLRAVFERGKWKWLRIDELAETCSGTTPSRSRQDFYGGKIPWVKTGELVDGIIHDTEEHITETALRETSLRLLPKNTLLIAMYGQGQTRGRTALLACEATTNQACYAILPNEKFDPKFLQLWFQFSYARLRQASEGRGGNQSNFNGKVLGAERVPLPPVPEQRAITARLDAELTDARTLVAKLESRLAEIELLPAALLRSAFNGN